MVSGGGACPVGGNQEPENVRPIAQGFCFKSLEGFSRIVIKSDIAFIKDHCDGWHPDLPQHPFQSSFAQLLRMLVAESSQVSLQELLRAEGNCFAQGCTPFLEPTHITSVGA